MAKRQREEDSSSSPIHFDIPRLSSLPLVMMTLEAPVCNALHAAEAALLSICAGRPDHASIESAKLAADAARESTFPHIERNQSEYNGAYAAAGLQYAAALVAEAQLQPQEAASSSSTQAPQFHCKAAESALRALDLAMLRGGVDEWGQAAEPLVRAAHRCLAERNAERPSPDGNDGTGASHADQDADADAQRRRREQGCPHFTAGESKPEGSPIPRIDARSLTLADFEARYMRSTPAPTPVILTHAIDDWPAVGGAHGRRWSMDYLRRIAGGRLVPVETYAEDDSTSTYLSASWDRKVITVADYIDQYVLKEKCAGARADTRVAVDTDESVAADSERGYLAQHPLFDQIPTLRDDIHEPTFCKARSEADKRAPSACEVRQTPIVSAWFGPAGTVSPLHNDPFHNLLAQVVGSKYVRLIDARFSPRLYPRSGALCNNSHVNLDQPAPSQHPLFEGTPFWQCVLGPSEVLYIPRLCWHYVRSLDVSMSVSFWWGARMALCCKDDGTVEEKY